MPRGKGSSRSHNPYAMLPRSCSSVMSQAQTRPSTRSLANSKNCKTFSRASASEVKPEKRSRRFRTPSEAMQEKRAQASPRLHRMEAKGRLELRVSKAQTVMVRDKVKEKVRGRDRVTEKVRGKAKVRVRAKAKARARVKARDKAKVRLTEARETVAARMPELQALPRLGGNRPRLKLNSNARSYPSFPTEALVQSPLWKPASASVRSWTTATSRPN